MTYTLKLKHLIIFAIFMVTLLFTASCTRIPRTQAESAEKPVPVPVPVEMMNAKVKFHGDAGKADAKYYFVGDASSAIVPEGYTPLYPVSVNRLIGFMDKEGNLVIEPQFLAIGTSSEGLLSVSIVDDKGKDHLSYSGYLGENGQYAISPRFCDAGDFSEGLARASLQLGIVPETFPIGFIDHSGAFVIPAKYYGHRDFSDGVVWVQQKEHGLSGCIDTKGNVVIPFSYDFKYDADTSSFREGYCFVSTEKKPYVMKDPLPYPKYYIDKSGKKVEQIGEVEGGSFFDGGVSFIESKEAHEWILIDKNGKRLSKSSYDGCVIIDKDMNSYQLYSLIGVEYLLVETYLSRGSDDEIYLFVDGFAMVFTYDGDAKFGLIDREGNEVIKPQYDVLGFFVDGLAKVKIGDSYGYINKLNQQVIKPKYPLAHDFSEELAAVMVENGLYGYIDKKGRMIIEPAYNNADKFKCGLASVQKGDKWIYIDAVGKVVWEPTE